MADLERLDARQMKAAMLLASGYTRQQAASELRISERTLYRWVQTETFQNHVRAEQNRLRGELVSALRRSVMKAIGVLEQALDGDGSQRLLAARALVSAGARLLSLLEVADLSERVEKLEKALGGTHGNGKFSTSH